MHRTAEALLEILAFPAHPRAHPCPVAHKLKTAVPHIQQIILIDVSLHETTVDVRAGGDAAVNQHAADVDARPTEKIAVANLFLVFARIGFAAEGQADTVFPACFGDELHHLLHLCA